MRLFKFHVALIALMILFSVQLQSQNWPGWRGPNGDGTSNETNLPVEWDATKNIEWKSEVPGVGHSSPIIWEYRLFTLTSFPETKEKVLLCYDSRNGNLLWKETVFKGSWFGLYAQR